MPFKTIARFGKKPVRTQLHVEAIRRLVKSRIKEKPHLFDALFWLIRHRRSARKYENRDIPQSDVEKILLAGTWAPSEGNQQPWEFIVVRDYQLRKQLAEASLNQDWMVEAPVFIIVCINSKIATAVYGERGVRLYSIQTSGAVVQNMLLTAESLGLSSCWVGAFSEPQVALILGCPDYVRPAAIITLGYSAVKPSAPVRQPLHDVAYEERFGRPLFKTVIKAGEVEQRPEVTKGYVP